MDEELEKALRELCDADDECKAHFKRHPRVHQEAHGYNQADNPREAEADWRSCYNRKVSAEEAILKLARQRFR